MEQEKRRHPRVQCVGRAEVHVEFDKEPIPAKVLNLSTGGCLLVLDRPSRLSRDALVELTFTINQLPFRVRAQVRATHSENGVGFQFPQLSSRTAFQLEELVDELAAMHAKMESNRQMVATRRTERLQALG